MNKPELYIQKHILPQIDADYVLKKNEEVLKSNDNCSVLDVGCGPGNVTFEKILPLLSATTKRVLGVDVSHHHIEYARNHYQHDPRISYEVLDILIDVVPKEYGNAFDLVISLYCLHYVGNHQKAFTNIYEMLKPNGKVLISFLGKSVLGELYSEISQKPKWSKYMTDIAKSCPPYRPKDYYETLLTEIGFEHIRCEEVKKYKYYSEEEAFDILNAVNMYGVPKSEELEFIQDHMQIYEEKGCLTVQEDGKKQLNFRYHLFIIVATKSSTL